MFSLLLGPHTGPRWEGNQRAKYVSELATACETRARSLGLDALRPLTRPVRPNSDPAFTPIFEQAIQAAVRELPAALERDMFFRDSRGRDQCERLARDCPALRWRWIIPRLLRRANCGAIPRVEAVRVYFP